MRVLFTCGGTGGHICPALAVAGVLRRRGAKILFVGAENGMEKKLVPDAGFEIKTVHTRSFRHKATAVAYNLGTLRRLAGALSEAKAIIREFKPDVVFGTGGYACFPVMRQAARMGIPCALHESNAAPGLATRALAKKMDCIFINYDVSKVLYKQAIVTGMPIREEFLLAKGEKPAFCGGLPLVISAFGSNGASYMNKHMMEFVRLVEERGEFALIHAKGKKLTGGLWPDTSAYKHVEVREYIDDMPELMNAADCMICRAGSSTLGELCVTGTPAVLIPSPYVTNDHQSKNAKVLSDSGAAVVLSESDCNAEILYRKVLEILASPERLESCRKAMLGHAVPDAAERISEKLAELAKKGKLGS